GFVEEVYILTKLSNVNTLKSNPAIKYYLDGVFKNWLQASIPQKVKIDFIARQSGNLKAADLIKAYFDQNKISSKELGTYWEEGAWKSWRRISISEHASLIKYYFDNGTSSNDIDQMKIWLLKHKQVQGWPSFQTTSDAIFALMVTGSKKEISMIKSLPSVLIDNQKSP
ncbi:MAG TPA: hypothetical protein PKD85_21770, partial [Saprospiraceae bacterium]|nr:hypothetical protein [Saprospiraceae bacterium]